MYLCVCVCVHLCVSLCMCIWVVHPSACQCVYPRVSVCVHMCPLYLCVYVSVCVSGERGELGQHQGPEALFSAAATPLSGEGMFRKEFLLSSSFCFRMPHPTAFLSFTNMFLSVTHKKALVVTTSTPVWLQATPAWPAFLP